MYLFNKKDKACEARIEASRKEDRIYSILQQPDLRL